jgi:hypothetical protein
MTTCIHGVPADGEHGVCTQCTDVDHIRALLQYMEGDDDEDRGVSENITLGAPLAKRVLKLALSAMTVNSVAFATRRDCGHLFVLREPENDDCLQCDRDFWKARAGNDPYGPSPVEAFRRQNGILP